MTVKSLAYQHASTIKIVRVITPTQEVYTYTTIAELLNSPYLHNTVSKIDYEYTSHLDLYITE